VGREADERFNQGNALARQGRLAEAEAAYREVLRLEPRDFQAMCNLADCLRKLRRVDEAIALYRAALELEPREARLHTNLSAALEVAGRLEEAEAHLRRALEIDPQYEEAHVNLGWLLLVLGRFGEGWPEYRWRAAQPAPRLPASGAPIELRGAGGLGDQLFFLRFAPRLAALGTGPLSASVDARLLPLLERAASFARFVALPGTPDAVSIEARDLALLTRMTTAADVPPPLPLACKEELREKLAAELAALGPRPYLGVVWRAGTPRDERRLFKEVPPEALGAALRAVPGTVLVLQREANPAEMERFATALGRAAHDLSAAQQDLERLLALLDLLDDYVGVSSTAVHLRAGLGRGARVLVPSPPEWRWMAAGASSPWFPGSRTYRQDVAGSWEAALEALAQDLS
jgi:tetratricopeptide (TPR) repeat protein